MEKDRQNQLQVMNPQNLGPFMLRRLAKAISNASRGECGTPAYSPSTCKQYLATGRAYLAYTDQYLLGFLFFEDQIPGISSFLTTSRCQGLVAMPWPEEDVSQYHVIENLLNRWIADHEYHCLELRARSALTSAVAQELGFSIAPSPPSYLWHHAMHIGYPWYPEIDQPSSPRPLQVNETSETLLIRKFWGTM